MTNAVFLKCKIRDLVIAAQLNDREGIAEHLDELDDIFDDIDLDIENLETELEELCQKIKDLESPPDDDGPRLEDMLPFPDIEDLEGASGLVGGDE